MTTDTSKMYTVKKCPHWTENNGDECKMTKGGLYIPMPEHVSMFCMSSRYAHCHQYIRGEELLQEAARNFGYIVEDGRRRYRRVSDRFQLVLSSCDDDMTPLSVLDDHAFTLDLSLGGMRLESRRKISTGRPVAFAFSRDFTIPDLSGTGEVRWCEPDRDSGGFVAGLEFSDGTMSRAIGSHMGLPMM